MDSQEKLLLGIVIALALIALYITFVQPAQPMDESAYALELIKKSVETGKGMDEYYYSYTETSDDYSADYALLLKGGEKMLEIKNPFADKEIYFLDDDTILCESFAGVEVCSSMKNNTDSYFVSYLNSLKSVFFSDSAIESEIEKLDDFYDKGYLTVSPETSDKTVNGNPCKEIRYTIDYTTMLISDANRYGIPTSSPKKFDFVICVDAETGLAYTKHFTYSYGGSEHEWGFVLIEADWNPAQEIVPPEELAKGAYDALLEEKQWIAKYQACDAWSGEQKDNCVSDIALTLKSKKVCTLAGVWEDRCLLTVSSLTGDETICPDISDAGYKDDCYIEVAHYKQDNSYCSNIANSSKVEICNDAARPPEPTGNETGLANPAAVNCADKEYDYEIRTDETGGEYGVCMHEGLECEEWALFRGECCLTNEDCPSGTCADQNCTVAESTGNDTNSTVDIAAFLNYIDSASEDNETINETESS